MTELTKEIRHAVIPAAGKGTRMSSITSGGAKELLTIGGNPVIAYALQDAIAAGISNIYFIVSPRKPEIESYFRSNPLIYAGNTKVRFNDLNQTGIECRFIVQHEPEGLAHALSLAEEYIENDDFLAIMPDTYFPESPSPAAQIIKNYNPGRCCMGIVTLNSEKLRHYGSTCDVKFAMVKEKTVLVSAMSEKRPASDKLNAGQVVYRSGGGVVYSRDFFTIYREMRKPEGSELDDVNVIHRLIDEGLLDGCLIEGIGFDAGSPAGYEAAVKYSG